MVSTKRHYILIVFTTTILVVIFFTGSSLTSAQQPVENPPVSEQNNLDIHNVTVLPYISKPPESNIDLTIEKLIVTQATQTEINSVPLVANRSTLVRVFAKTNQSIPTQGILVSLNASRNGQNLPGSPLVSNSSTVLPNPSRESLESTFNFSIPNSWSSGQVTLEAHVDPTQNLVETNEGNNSSQLNLSFTDLPPLDVKIVPINYFHTSGSEVQYYPAQSSDYFSDDVLKMFPLHDTIVSFHTPVNFYGDLTNSGEWSNLLSQLTSLKLSEGALESQVWYGAIPVEDTAGNSWRITGPAGLGWIGYRVALGLYDSTTYHVNGGNIAAHEIGHNLGREHSPCGVTNYDPNYPYANGVIGQYGMDVLLQNLIQYTIPDIMSYCTPNWISDYTYAGLFYDQAQNGSASAAPKSEMVMLVRADLNSGEQIEVDPLYVYEGYVYRESNSSGEFRIQLLNDAGDIVAEHPAAVLRAEEPGYSYHAIDTSIPVPEEGFTTFRLLKENEVVHKKSINTAATEQMTSQPASPAQGDPGIKLVNQGSDLYLEWSPADIPAMVRYKVEGSQNWTTLGIDISGGSLLVLPERLPPGQITFEVNFAGFQTSPVKLDWNNN